MPDLPSPDDVTDERVRDLPPADEPTATITPYRDGPLLVRGEFRLVDTEGNEIDPGRRTVALCRCGKSGIKPFCDGTHKRAGFHAASAPVRSRPAARVVGDDASLGGQGVVAAQARSAGLPGSQQVLGGEPVEGQ